VGKRGLLGVLAALLTAALPIAAAQPAAAARKPKVVYLTFDDGPNSLNTPHLLRLLHRERVSATFFVLGQALALDPLYATQLWLAGHAVGNHTWSHQDLTFLSPLAIRDQLRSTQRLEGPAGGACMRPPYGAMNTSVRTVASELGLTPVMWTIDPQDWAHQDAAHITNHVLSLVQDRSIVLLHDGGGPRAATISAVRTLIPQLRLRGYEFRTIPACRVAPLTGNATRMIDRADPPRPKPTPPPDPGQPVAPPAVPAEMSR
jgi:peptidoglycan/xylan/chitin deacetylase (PgdA/CDA1 family)